MFQDGSMGRLICIHRRNGSWIRRISFLSRFRLRSSGNDTAVREAVKPSAKMITFLTCFPASLPDAELVWEWMTTRMFVQEMSFDTSSYLSRYIAHHHLHQIIHLPIASLLTISRTFNSLFKVLFIFPSRYLFAIGLSPLFSFRWGIPPI